jgi:hypothetical protein
LLFTAKGTFGWQIALLIDLFEEEFVNERVLLYHNAQPNQ